MSIMLSQVSGKVEKEYGMELVAGSKGLNNIVRWVHIVEDLEVPDFLHGSELVFTTGIAHVNSDWIIDFVRNLYENNASGVVLNIGPYIRDIPPQVIVFCEENNFPLFKLPWNSRIIDITYQFCRRIINNEKNENSVAEAFKNLIFSLGNERGYLPVLRKAGFYDANNNLMLAIRFSESDKIITNHILSKHKQKLYKIIKSISMTNCVFYHENMLIVVVQANEYDDISRILSGLSDFAVSLKAEANCSIGISTVMRGYNNISELFVQARSAMIVSVIKNSFMMKYENIGIYKLILDQRNNENLQSFYKGVLGKLIEYDAENNTDYCDVLHEYLDSSGSIQQVAQKTGVHRNTINYKIRQIKGILDISINDEDKMNLQLAFIALDVLKYM